ncbi:MAG TPA: hypothetical protein VHB79_38895 [Polyangiaceae bacterium]|nr:hypothetical protein [Polyangiaceae bacterium]
MVDEAEVVLGEGTAAVLDVLGFKAARRTHGVEKLVSAVRRLRQHMEMDEGVRQIFGGTSTTTAAFSDSVILTKAAGQLDADGTRETLSQTVEHTAAAAAQLVTDAISGDVPLPFRGCIAAGPLLVFGDIFVGDAIDAAAEFAEQALAAVVWLAPSALKALSASRRRSILMLVEWEVPLRGGRIETLVVNPFWQSALLTPTQENAEAEFAELTTKLLAPFDGVDALDVAQKRQNTASFLRHAAAVSRDKWKDLEDHTWRRTAREGSDH